MKLSRSFVFNLGSEALGSNPIALAINIFISLIIYKLIFRQLISYCRAQKFTFYDTGINVLKYKRRKLCKWQFFTLG